MLPNWLPTLCSTSSEPTRVRSLQPLNIPPAPLCKRLVSKNLGLELTHERHQILFFLMSQFNLKNHVKELDSIF